MTGPENPEGSGEETGFRTADSGHPRGTLFIVILFGLLFGLGWIALFVFRFLERGAPR